MICVSVSFYALAKVHGAALAKSLVKDMLRAPDEQSLPAIRTIMQVRELGDCALWPDFGGAATGKMRSRAAHAAWESGADVWISCDDDVEASGETTRDLVDAVAGDEPRVVLAPYLQRGSDVVMVGVVHDQAVLARVLPHGGQTVPALGGGFGLVAMNRPALALIREANAHLTFRDDDGEEKLGLFVEELAGGKWWGEDLAFFRRIPPGVSVEALIRGATSHEGQFLDLATLPDAKRLDLTGFRAVPEVAHNAPSSEPTAPPAEHVDVVATPVPDPEVAAVPLGGCHDCGAVGAEHHHPMCNVAFPAADAAVKGP